MPKQNVFQHQKLPHVVIADVTAPADQAEPETNTTAIDLESDPTDWVKAGRPSYGGLFKPESEMLLDNHLKR